MALCFLIKIHGNINYIFIGLIKGEIQRYRKNMLKKT